MSFSTPITLRPGTAADVPAAYALITELALFERAPQEVITTPETMLRDGFGPRPLYEMLVAEPHSTPGTLVGMALWYYRYSTWKGKRLYLDDIIVTESWRGQGIGRLLLEAVVAKARAESCTGLMWQVLDWNERAIAFYKRWPVTLDGGRLNVHLNF